MINKKIKIKLLKKNEHVVTGSTSRLKSLNKCLDLYFKNNYQTEYTLIHDIARPVLNITDVRNILKEIKKSVDGSSLGYPLTNAIKELKNGKITNNIFVRTYGLLLHHKYLKQISFINQLNFA